MCDLQVEPGEERYFITSCSDNSIALFDLRKMGKGSKPAATATHSLTCQSAFFAPDGAPCTLNAWRCPSSADAEQLPQAAALHVTAPGLGLPAGSGRVLTCSRDNTLKVWDSKRDLNEVQSWDHYNNTGRWVVPFRAIWGPRSDAVICGSMKRSVSVPLR